MRVKKKVEFNQEKGYKCNPKAFIIDDNTVLHSVVFNMEYNGVNLNDDVRSQFSKLILKGLESTLEIKHTINTNSRNWWNFENRSFHSVILDFNDKSKLFGKFNSVQKQNSDIVTIHDICCIINDIYKQLIKLEDKRFYLESINVKYKKPIKNLYLKHRENAKDFYDTYYDIMNDKHGIESLLHFIEDDVYVSLNCHNTLDENLFTKCNNTDSFMKILFKTKGVIYEKERGK